MNRKMLFVLCFVTLFGPSLISSQESVTLGHCHLNCDGYDSLAIEDQSMESQLNDARRKLAETDLQMNNIQSELTETRNNLTETRSNLTETRNNLTEARKNLTAVIDRLNTVSIEHEARMNETTDRLTEVMNELNQAKSDLSALNKQVHIKDCTGFNLLHGEAVADIYPYVDQSKMVRAMCDMSTSPGGWTVIQRRYDGSQPFNLTWNDYKKGFGQANAEHWLGLDNIHGLTKGGNQMLRIELEDGDGKVGYAQYSTFIVEPESDNYRLTISGYTGNISDSIDNTGNSLHNLNNQPFSTFDIGSCATSYGGGGGWWYNSCKRANLNGKYGADGGSGIVWYYWHNNTNSMRSSKMMIRRK